MRNLRIASQAIFLKLFLGTFFFVIAYPAAYSLPANWFLRLNPLVALVTSVASRSVVVPLLVLGSAVALLTVVFGRFFCGFVCPLGTIIDLSDRFLLRKSLAPSRRPPRYVQRTKYVLLGAILVLALFGAAFPLFMDPISLTTRIATLVAHPLVVLLEAMGVDALRGSGIDRFATLTVTTRTYYGTLGALLLLGAVLVGGLWDRRFWCQYVCPSGAFFGLLSRFALFRRVVVESGCSSCRRCSRSCPTRAINDESLGRTSTAECIVCGVCTSLRRGCSRFAFVAPSGAAVEPADIRRRHVAAGLLGGLALLPFFRANALNRRDSSGRLIRPPGAVPEEQFLASCIACGACMKACPTGALQPCTAEDGVHRMFTPKVVPRIGGCEEKCSLCGYVCPTGALRRLPAEEKQFVKIGTAVIDQHRCLAWAQNKECLVCDETCPYNAIEARVVETSKGPFKVPIMYQDLCLGCGMCEHHCPIDDTAAIVVYRFGEKRLRDGPYESVQGKAAILEQRRRSDAHLSIESPGASGAARDSTTGNDTSLPPGFVQ